MNQGCAFKALVRAVASKLASGQTSQLVIHQRNQLVHGRTAREALSGAIYENAPNSLILVLGPTGVGKTTLRIKAEQLLTTAMSVDLEADPGRFPVVSIECIAPESGAFSWRDHFRRLLLTMEEPLLDYKLHPGKSIHIADRTIRFMPNARAAGTEYRYALRVVLPRGFEPYQYLGSQMLHRIARETESPFCGSHAPFLVFLGAVRCSTNSTIKQ